MSIVCGANTGSAEREAVFHYKRQSGLGNDDNSAFVSYETALAGGI